MTWADNRGPAVINETLTLKKNQTNRKKRTNLIKNAHLSHFKQTRGASCMDRDYDLVRLHWRGKVFRSPAWLSLSSAHSLSSCIQVQQFNCPQNELLTRRQPHETQMIEERDHDVLCGRRQSGGQDDGDQVCGGPHCAENVARRFFCVLLSLPPRGTPAWTPTSSWRCLGRLGWTLWQHTVLRVYRYVRISACGILIHIFITFLPSYFQKGFLHYMVFKENLLILSVPKQSMISWWTVGLLTKCAYKTVFWLSLLPETHRESLISAAFLQFRRIQLNEMRAYPIHVE